MVIVYINKSAVFYFVYIDQLIYQTIIYLAAPPLTHLLSNTVLNTATGWTELFDKPYKHTNLVSTNNIKANQGYLP